MANNIFEKNQKILYNSIPEQRLTYANQLTVKSWNDIVNILKTQANINADYIERLHKWLIGTGTGNVSIDGTKSFVEYILTDYVSLTRSQKIEGRKIFSDSVSFEGGTAYFDVYAEFNSDAMFRENVMLEAEPNEDLHIVNKKYVDKGLNEKVDTSLFQTATTAIIDSLTQKADIEYVHGKFNQLLGEGASETLDTIGEISRALEENIDVVEALDNAVTNKADKSYVDDIIGNLNIYDYIVYNNPEVKGDTLFLENGYVIDGVLYLKNSKVVEGVLYIDYIE